MESMASISVDSLKDLPLDELSKIAQVATIAIQEKHEIEMLEAWKVFTNKVKELDMSVDEALAICYKKVKRAERVVPIKYQDPNNENNVWSGRGKTPNWLTTYIESGKSKDDFLVED